MPPTWKVKTGGGGWHHWFRFPPGTKCGKPAPGIDRKAEGGLVIVPPSRILIPEHGGRPYSWDARPWEGVPLADAPAWCLGEPQRGGVAKGESNPWVVQAPGDDLLTHPGSPEGERHSTLCRLAGIHLARGDSPTSIMGMAEAWAARCNPPFGGWHRVVEGLTAKEAAKAEDLTTPSPLCRTTCTITEECGDTLWPGREGTNWEPFTEPELVPSLPPSGESGKGREGLSANWPTLSPEAEQGLFGEMLKTVTPETEADSAGILLGWLCCFGNAVGRDAWLPVGPRLHYPALYCGIVGLTSDAKGDGWNVALWPFQQIEPAWAANCIANGVGSGEGLIERIADAQQVLDKDGNVKNMPGASDKRCLLRLSELSKCFKIQRRENSTLSDNLREAWDGEPIHVPNRKGNALATTGYTVSVFGDITPGVVRKLLEGGTEGFDGFANRFLWCVVQSGRDLPSGGNIEVLKPFLERLKAAMAFAKSVGQMKRDADADALWCEVYPSLKRSGDSVPHTDRARPYVVRLSMLYALADCSAVIRREHLAAALAVWDYCRASARLLFSPDPVGGKVQPDPLWLSLLNAICRKPGISRTELREVAGHKVKAEEIEAALASLVAAGKVYPKMVQPEGGGRPAERWWPVLGPTGDGETESVPVDNPSPPSARESRADVESVGREQLNPGLSGDGGADTGEQTPGRELTPAAVSLFLPASAIEVRQQKQGGTGVVRREAFDYEPEGGFKASVEAPAWHWKRLPPEPKPLPRERWRELAEAGVKALREREAHPDPPPADRESDPLWRILSAEGEELEALLRLVQRE
jgi:hypothetical protein